MAAVILAPQHQPRPRTAPRPALRVIEGGPDAARRRRQPAEVYRRRRIAVAVLAVVVLGTVVLALVGAATLLAGGPAATEAPGAGAAPSSAAAAVASPAPEAPRVHVVRPGDTLWSIARSLRPDGDVRPLVDQLAARLGGASLQAGQRIPLDGLAS